MRDTFIIFLILSFFSFQAIYAQQDTIPPPRSLQKEEPGKKRKLPKFTAGGGVGLHFGTYNAIEIQPQIGVYATKWLLVGINADYSYMWTRYTQANSYSSNVVGVGAFLQPILFKKLLLLAGYDFTYVYYDWKDVAVKETYNYHTIYAGIGIKQYMGKKAYFQALVLINAFQTGTGVTKNQYYVPNYYPFLRIGIGVDL